MHLATLDGAALTEALRRMKDIRGGKLGEAHWRFRDRLTIDWAGMEESVDAEVETPMPYGVTVSAQVMKHLTARLSWEGPIAIGFDEDRLVIGRDRIPATARVGPRRHILPVDASPRAVLVAVLREGPDAIAEAGYADECTAVTERWRKSIARAAKSIAWTGIDEQTLAELVAERLRSRG